MHGVKKGTEGVHSWHATDQFPQHHLLKRRELFLLIKKQVIFKMMPDFCFLYFSKMTLPVYLYFSKMTLHMLLNNLIIGDYTGI